jgi:hypothetical protein
MTKLFISIPAFYDPPLPQLTIEKHRKKTPRKSASAPADNRKTPQKNT